MSDDEKISGGGNWRGIDLNGRGIDFSKASVKPNGDIWESGTPMGNAYNIQSGRSGSSLSPQDYASGFKIILGIAAVAGIVYIGSQFVQINSEMSRARTEYYKQKPDEGPAVDLNSDAAAQQQKIETTQRYKLLRTAWHFQNTAHVALLQQDTHYLSELAKENILALPLNTEIAPIPIDGQWSTTVERQARDICLDLYEKKQCAVKGNNVQRATLSLEHIDGMLVEIVQDACLNAPGAGSPACERAIDYLEMRDGTNH